MGQAYVGFYWTLPVPRRGFRVLPNDVEAAARRSRTIRYQLEVIRRFVRNEKGQLVGEAVFMEMEADRGTEQIEEELNRVVHLCAVHDATLIYVDFSHVHHWRPHAFMRTYLANHDVPRLDLRPDPVFIDGQTFDPVKHFRHWQRRHDKEAPALRDRARTELKAAVRSLPEGPGRWQVAADDLNRRGITTGTGRRWTSEGVRKTYTRQQPVPAED
ncbi:hypothetical protein [Methylobacterium sp. WL8]|uniref:hypothetical protein n=1 Tax=Methylobacterium sp. WL8 TaxID=2603899 RepID=UPI0011C879FF|nr:hypothetical protein [Methylobacterium sp. WL8]TXN81268.1 hypothetical protein FV234_13960 [Methylobacterium sp. WL8]